jgi:predicted O-methyltransferase YrrM
MKPLLQEIFETGVVRDASGKEYKLHAAVSADTGATLANAIKSCRPKISVEIGLAQGISSLFICDALTEVGANKHYIIDPNQSAEWHNIGLSHLQASGYGSLIELREEMSHNALPKLMREDVKIDFAFIDGWHVFDQVIVDFFYIDKMLNVGGVIAFDDSVWPSVQKALRYILRNRNYVPIGNSKSTPSRYQNLARKMRPVSRHLTAVLKPEFTEPGGSLGIAEGSGCIVLKKIGNDNREITYHRDF